MDERAVGLGLGIFWSLFLEDALTQKKAGFPCNRLNAESYFISQDEG